LNLNGTASQPFRLMRMILSEFPQAAIAGLINVLEPEVHLDQVVLEELAPLTWGMAAEMHRQGFEIGSHTVSHPLLTQESAATVENELVCSKKAIEAKLGTAVKHFAYPDGRFNRKVVETVRAAGYRYAYGICPTQDPGHPLLTIPRKVLWEKAAIDPRDRFSPAMMNCHAHWAFDRRNCEHDHGLNGVEQSCQVRLNIA
jgi:peptidoglycan/xylan/chitin deacetylase (PgdA/CDA1 family)